MTEVNAADRRSYVRALTVLRSFVGVVYLTNGASRLFGFNNSASGRWRQYLIDRSGDSALSNDAEALAQGNSPGFRPKLPRPTSPD